jgi:2-polyprenyl-3-methyl-5-hydroxy-6-metoxy-1,4-benzoquinol methylase
MSANENSWRTAIGRNKISKPTRFLLSHGWLDLMHRRVLDFGCGRGYDADQLGFEKYDPHFFPKKPKGKFDVVLCHFVLNVLPKKHEKKLLEEIESHLKPDGTAFITVRRDLKQEGFTPKGTYQRNVVLTGCSSVYKDSDIEIYRTSKH